MITFAIMTMLGTTGIQDGLTSQTGTEIVLLIVAELIMLVIMAYKQNTKK